MKKIISVIFLLGLCFYTFSQDIILKFTAVDYEGNHIQLDSIRASKWTNIPYTSWNSTLYFPDTTIVISSSYISELKGDNEFSLETNENPFAGKTSAVINMPDECVANVILTGIDGSVVSTISETLHKGNNLIEINTKDAKVYILTVSCKYGTKSVKLLNIEKGESNTITYAGCYNSVLQPKVTANENLSVGDTLDITAYIEIDGFMYILEKRHIIESSADITFHFGDIRPYETFTDERDGNVYKYIQIGEQVWMAENLRYLPSVNGNPYYDYSFNDPKYYVFDYLSGTSIEEAKNHLCSIYAGKYKGANSYRQFGVYYNGAATIGACPSGWHLPTDSEWTQLEIYLQNNGYNSNGIVDTDDDRETNNFTAKSLASVTGWELTDSENAVGNNPEDNNSTGFRGLPCGASFSSEISLGNACWWTDTNANIGIYYRIIGGPGSDAVYRADGPFKYALNIRCVRD